MTNEEAIAFAQLAAMKLGFITNESALVFEDEMSYLFDIYTGTEVIEKVRKEIMNEED